MSEKDSDKKVMMHQIKSKIHQRLIGLLDMKEAQRFSVEQLHQEVSSKIDQLITQEKYPLSGPEKQQLLSEVLDEIFGLGPLEPFLRDPMVSDILVNGSKQIYMERQGRLEATNVCFQDNAHLLRVIQRIGTNVGRRIDESSPMLDARLADGSRVNAIIPPLALDGPALSIRRFGTNPIDIHKLLELETLTGRYGVLSAGLCSMQDQCADFRRNRFGENNTPECVVALDSGQ